MVYLAPPDYHTLIEADGTIALSTEAAVRHARPSIDVLFRSAAEAYRERCVGVVLTGANEDGADGLALIKKLGGVAVVQDPRTAERREMPSAAIEATNADIVLPLEEIGLFLRGLLSTTCTRRAARRAGGGTRTHGPRFTKAVLYQLSYSGAQRRVAPATAGLRGTAGASGSSA